MASQDPQDENAKKGPIPAWLLNDSVNSSGNSSAQSGSPIHEHKEHPVNEWIFNKIFNRNPFFRTIVRKMDRDLAGLNEESMSRLDQMMRAAEGLKKGDPLQITEKSYQRFDGIKKELAAKKASMSKEEYHARAAEFEREAFKKYFPELKKGFESEKETGKTPSAKPAPQEMRSEQDLEGEGAITIVDKLITYSTVVDKNTKPPLKFRIHGEEAFKQCGAVNLFPNTNFGEYIMDPKNNELTQEIILKESNVVRFQIFFGCPYVLTFLTERMKIHLRKLFENVERCTKMVKLLQFYADLKKNYWRFAMIDIMLPILYCNQNSDRIFFTGGKIDIDLDGKTDFTISPWFSLNGNTISMNEKAVENDMVKFWDIVNNPTYITMKP